MARRASWAQRKKIWRLEYTQGIENPPLIDRYTPSAVKLHPNIDDSLTYLVCTLQVIS
jgi:hypothetical protein